MKRFLADYRLTGSFPRAVSNFRQPTFRPELPLVWLESHFKSDMGAGGDTKRLASPCALAPFFKSPGFYVKQKIFVWGD
jgi:hypothetical protein